MENKNKIIYGGTTINTVVVSVVKKTRKETTTHEPLWFDED